MGGGLRGFSTQLLMNLSLYSDTAQHVLLR